MEEKIMLTDIEINVINKEWVISSEVFQMLYEEIQIYVDKHRQLIPVYLMEKEPAS